MTEIWKDIKGYEGRYQISNMGNIRVLKSRVNTFKKPKPMKPFIYSKSKTQYKRIELANPTKKFLVHRLVATAFIEKPEGCDVVNHLDNNGLNNVYTNLEWGTQGTNLLHAQNQGRLTEAQSKGGINHSIKAREQALKNADNLIGTIKGTWTVIENLGFFNIGTKGVQRIKLKCACSCGNTYIVDKFYFIKQKPKTCKSCR